MVNEQVKELCGVKKGVNERFDERVLPWFVHTERMDNSWITKRVCVGEGIRSSPVVKGD